jgi:hypothetical protein
VIYLIGSLRSLRVPLVAKALRAEGFDIFDDWYTPGRDTDDYWQEYEKARGHTYKEALEGWHAKHVFAFDLFHLKRAAAGILLLPAGKSGHLELGWLLGQGKPGYILLNGEPDRYDMMYQFATAVHTNLEDLVKDLKQEGRRFEI